MKSAFLGGALGALAAAAGAEEPRDMPVELRGLFSSEQYARAVWLDCNTGSMRMKLAMQLLSRADTDYGAVHHVLSPFAADGSSLGLVEALSDWVADEIAPEQIADRFMRQCIELAVAERT